MSKRAKLAAAIAGALLVCVLTILTVANREPRYQGLTMGQWLKRADYAQRDEALLILGTNNLPLLVKRLAFENDTDLLYRAAHLIPERFKSKRISEFLMHRSDCVAEAKDVLKRLGTNAAPAIPKIAAIAARGGWRGDDALGILANLGDEGLAIIVSKAADTNVLTRLRVAWLLAEKTESRPAFMALTNALADPDPFVRDVASYGVARHVDSNPHLAPTERNQFKDLKR